MLRNWRNLHFLNIFFGAPSGKCKFTKCTLHLVPEILRVTHTFLKSPPYAQFRVVCETLKNLHPNAQLLKENSHFNQCGAPSVNYEMILASCTWDFQGYPNIFKKTFLFKTQGCVQNHEISTPICTVTEGNFTFWLYFAALRAKVSIYEMYLAHCTWDFQGNPHIFKKAHLMHNSGLCAKPWKKFALWRPVSERNYTF
jgi:hypothetical protein